MVKYEDFVSTFRLWQPELTSVMVVLHTLVSLGSTSFNVGPLCIGLINAWLSLAGSRHKGTAQLNLGTTMKLLHLSAISPILSAAEICCPCSLSNSFLKGFLGACDMHIRGTWYDFASFLTCKSKVPVKHPYPINTLPYSLCILDVVLSFASLSASAPSPASNKVSY